MTPALSAGRQSLVTATSQPLPPLEQSRSLSCSATRRGGTSPIRPGRARASSRGPGPSASLAARGVGRGEAVEGGLAGLDAVLFLDVDGVLHPLQVRHPRQQFARSCMALLDEVLQTTGATVVLSTAWRLDPFARKAVEEKLREHGMPAPVSRTPSIAQFHRAKEILAWVGRYRPASWVALDDWPLMEEPVQGPKLAGHFVQTRPRFGLQRDTADRIVELFRKQREARG
uniref:Mitochondrial import inner membrane translocase subunit TIM50 n=1 Tax=Alexandrium monilatum TaxID=311494 RepID=A0A7S4W197_9DINO